MIYTYAPVTGIPTASFLFDSNISSNANISISKLNGYPSNGNVYLNGDGLWTIPPTIIPNDSLSLSQLQTVVNNANMVYTYAPVTGIPTASFLFDSNISSNANISISKLNGYPSNSNVYLNGDGLWTIPPTIIPNNSLSLSQLQTVVGNANMVYTYAPITGITTAALLLDSNISTFASISISKLNGYPSNSNVYLSGNGTWTTPPTIIPNNTITLSQLQTVVDNENMVYTYAPTTGVPTASLLVNSNISATANISISKLNGYPSNSNVYLSGNGTWTTPSTTIPNNTITLSQLQTVVGNENMVYTYAPTTGVPTAALLVDSNISATANINGSKILNSTITGSKIANSTISANNILNATITQQKMGFLSGNAVGTKIFSDMNQGLYIRSLVNTSLANQSFELFNSTFETGLTSTSAPINQQIVI
jgi:hypothetical protein